MDSKEKWRIRRRKAKDITVASDGHMEGANWDLLNQWQREFQNEFCPSCVRYDLEKKDFKEKGHENYPNDCKFHWIDIVGQCWNYKSHEQAQ